MSEATASGSAHDVGAEVTEDHDADLRARLAAIDAEMSDQERARLERRAELGREIYDLQHKVPGTREHAAHREQLVRLYDEALAATDSAQRALDKAREHAEGKELAVGDAQAAYVKAKDALDAFEQSYGTPDGSAE